MKRIKKMTVTLEPSDFSRDLIQLTWSVRDEKDELAMREVVYGGKDLIEREAFKSIWDHAWSKAKRLMEEAVEKKNG